MKTELATASKGHENASLDFTLGLWRKGWDSSSWNILPLSSISGALLK